MRRKFKIFLIDKESFIYSGVFLFVIRVFPTFGHFGGAACGPSLFIINAWRRFFMVIFNFDTGKVQIRGGVHFADDLNALMDARRRDR